MTSRKQRQEHQLLAARRSKAAPKTRIRPTCSKRNDLKPGYFTGLEVSHEPGQWAVWTGVVLMGFGLAIVFYFVHTRFWAVPVRDAANGKLTLWIGGTANAIAMLSNSVSARWPRRSRPN